KGISKNIAENITSCESTYNIDKELELIEAQGVEVLTIFDKSYPEMLKEIYDPPVVLYVKGILSDKDDLSLGVVGSRKCTQYGIRATKELVASLKDYEITIVSGLARGIDSVAHKAALENKLRTIAVLGSGLGCIYPLENAKLANDIALSGAVISEFPFETKPLKQNFPRRNRIISGLSKGIVVIEAAQRSGALITVDFALEQGRDVFAMPGPVDSESSYGTNRLIKQGAKLIDSAEDILSELGLESINKEDLVKK
ncbi:MAG: DNA-processing protein DprA, partial [Candidatus Saelkia tenebricola]|nr:DNA-processing protein DprA [Candidatus Saelkia tenebricola]